MIVITESASHKIKEMMKEEEKTLLRFGVVGGGCSGLSYKLGFAEEKLKEDVLIESEEIQVVIDEKELAIVKGTVIDYKESLMGGGFTINNPNAIASCGCGSSFRTKKEKGSPENC